MEFVGRDSSVDIAIRYGLDVPVLNPGHVSFSLPVPIRPGDHTAFYINSDGSYSRS
jgi:hypothetical protein